MQWYRISRNIENNRHEFSSVLINFECIFLWFSKKLQLYFRDCIFVKELGEWKRKKRFFSSVFLSSSYSSVKVYFLIRTQSIHLVLLNRTLFLISRQRDSRINSSKVSEKELQNLKSLKICIFGYISFVDSFFKHTKGQELYCHKMWTYE